MTTDKQVEAARDVFRSWCLRAGGIHGAPMPCAVTIRAALEAAAKEADEAATKRERERCAKVASDSYARWRDQGDKCEVVCDATACQDIETEILKGEE